MAWQQTIDKCLATITSNLVTFMSGLQFETLIENLYVQSILRPPPQVIACIENVFPFHTKTTKLVETALIEAMFQNIKNICTLYEKVYPHFYIIYECLPVNNIIMNTLACIHHKKLYGQLCAEYEHLYEAAKKIQRQWSLCITDPAYNLCRQRLHREYHQLTS
jgi:hypothetical protein